MKKSHESPGTRISPESAEAEQIRESLRKAKRVRSQKGGIEGEATEAYIQHLEERLQELEQGGRGSEER
jgi:hypothetical protein